MTGIADAASRGDIVMVLLPDEKHGEVYREEIADGIAPGNLLLFGHGFSIHYDEVEPLAGGRRRARRAQGPGPPGAPPVRRGARRPVPGRDPAGRDRQRAGARARLREGRSAARAAGVIQTTFSEETETDLFGEQAVLCGGVSELVKAGYETLVDAGYDPKMAYFECLHELKLIVDLMYEKGISGMRYSISNTAEYGDYSRGKRVIADGDAPGDEGHPRRDPVRRVRARVDRGEPRGAGELPAHARGGADQPIEREGKELRSMMDWIETDF